MNHNKDQLALIGSVSNMKNVDAYEETGERVRIFQHENSMNPVILDRIEEMDYEVEEINAYAAKERKDAGYVQEYVSSIEIVAKPQE